MFVSLSQKVNRFFCEGFQFEIEIQGAEDRCRGVSLQQSRDPNLTETHVAMTALSIGPPSEEEVTVVSFSALFASVSTSTRSAPSGLNMDAPSKPRTRFGASERAFNSSWYNKRSWLEYSVERLLLFSVSCFLSKRYVQHFH